MYNSWKSKGESLGALAKFFWQGYLGLWKIHGWEGSLKHCLSFINKSFYFWGGTWCAPPTFPTCLNLFWIPGLTNANLFQFPNFFFQKILGCRRRTDRGGGRGIRRSLDPRPARVLRRRDPSPHRSGWDQGDPVTRNGKILSTEIRKKDWCKTPR